MSQPDRTELQLEAIHEIFLDATEIPDPGDRENFLVAACRGDQELRHRVEELLSHHERAGDFLDRPLPQREEFRGLLLETPDLAGVELDSRYRLLRLLGSGGTGQVWLAEQTRANNRRVAIKLLHAGMDSARILSRFETEFRVLAGLHHPHIAAIFDSGVTQTGLPFLVMEFVDGQSLCEYCDTRQLSLEARLRLLISICQAVHYAHQQGVIHRDLKPGNLLVEEISGQAVPRVIDFGLARVVSGSSVDQLRLTEHGWYLGTPEYMSPEQMTASVTSLDARADVYSLGVILFQLLTGQTPFRCLSREPAALPDFFNAVRESDPPRPSAVVTESADQGVAGARGLSSQALAARLAGDLDWITLRALAKTASARYGSAAELAAELELHLAGQAVSAHPPGFVYRLEKLYSRRRSAVPGIAIALCTVLVGLSFGTWALLAKWDADADFRRAAVQARTAENAALTELRASLAQASEHLRSSLPEHQELARAALRQTAARWQQYANQAASDAAGITLRAEAHYRIGAIHRLLGESSEAHRLLMLARAALDAQSRQQQQPTPDLRSLAAETMSELARCKVENGDFQQARQLFNDAIAELNAAVAMLPEQPELVSTLAIIKRDYAMALINQGDARTAHKLLDESIRLLQELATRYPDRRRYAEDVEASNSVMAYCLRMLGQHDAALTVATNALGKTQTLLGEAPDNYDLRRRVAAQSYLCGLLLQDLGRLDESNAEMQRSEQGFAELSRLFPLEPELRRRRANSLNSLAVGLVRLQQPENALKFFEECRRIREELVAGQPRQPELLDELAITLQNSIAAAAALPNFTIESELPARMYELRKTLVADFPESPVYAYHLASASNLYGNILLQQQRITEADGVLQDGVQTLQQLMTQHPGVPLHRQLLGKLFYSNAEVSVATKRWDEALQRLQKAIETRDRHPADPLDAVFIAQCRLLNADVFSRSAQLERALEELQATEELVDQFPDKLPEVAQVRKHVQDKLSRLREQQQSPGREVRTEP
jgi:serine/threonine protein kinase